MEDNDQPTTDRPASNVAWLFSRLTGTERAMLIVRMATGLFVLGVVCHRELSTGPVAGASIMAAIGVLFIGSGVWHATVSALRKR